MLQETTAVGLGKLLQLESSTTSSSPSTSAAQYNTRFATPPPHVTLQTPCLERHLVVIKIIQLQVEALYSGRSFALAGIQVLCMTETKGGNA